MFPVSGCSGDDELSRNGRLEKAKEAAYGFLKKKVRTESEVTKSLLQKGFDEDIVQEVIACLRNYRLLDDQLYASDYIAKRRQSSRAAVENELKALGIKDWIISQALAAVDDSDEFNKALGLAESRYGGNKYNAAKVAVFLRRKGFEQDIINMVCEHLDSFQHHAGS